MIHIPKWDRDAIREEQEDDEKKCRMCGWYLKGVCHYSGEKGCEREEVKE